MRILKITRHLIPSSGLPCHRKRNDMPLIVTQLFDRLNIYWQLATIRYSLYAFIVMVNTFDAGVEGYDSFSQMTGMQIGKLALHMAGAAVGAFLAFIDTVLARMKQPSSVETTETHKDSITPEGVKSSESTKSQTVTPVDVVVPAAPVVTPAEPAKIPDAKSP